MRVQDFLLNSIPLLIQFYVKKFLQEDFEQSLGALENDSSLPRVSTYDFVIVGGGSAGCVLAGRLSENFNVLLLEAGGTAPPAAEVPFFAIPVASDPDINYFFKSLPMANASAKAAQGVVINHTGKMLGGSGSHNDLVHNRGSPKDFDNWATITNDETWTYANILQYFRKSEDFIGEKYGEHGDEYYGKGGPISVDTNVVPILPIWLAAGRELGFSISDPNGFQTESFTPMNKAIRKGHRTSSYSEYVRPFENTRENLTVIRYANVSEILIDENKIAYGVAFTRHGYPQIVHASKEVILSAGAFSSPLLLMKSGIGPVETLEDAGISVKVPIEAVGNNLSEHPAVILTPFHVNDSSIFPKMREGDVEQLSKDFQEGRGGLLGTIHEGPQCFKVSTKAEESWPDIWISIYPKIVIESDPEEILFYVVHGRPKSKGNLRMNTTAYRAGIRDDVQLAIIDYKMLSDPEDIDVMIEGIKFTFEIAENTKAFQSMNMTYGAVHDEECLEHEFRSDAYWKCVLELRTLSWIHMVGTCSMGPDSGNSDTSVVDSKFRVRGVERLRVVDASIMPMVPNANLNAPVMMVAEKAAHEISMDWQNEYPETTENLGSNSMGSTISSYNVYSHVFVGFVFKYFASRFI